MRIFVKPPVLGRSVPRWHVRLLNVAPPIRIRKKFPTLLVVISFSIGLPMYSWIAYSSGVPLDMVIIMAAISLLIGIGACVVAARIIKRYGGRTL